MPVMHPYTAYYKLLNKFLKRSLKNCKTLFKNQSCEKLASESDIDLKRMEARSLYCKGQDKTNHVK